MNSKIIRSLFPLFMLTFSSFLSSDVVSADELEIKSNRVSQVKVEIAKNNWESYTESALIDTNENLADFNLGQGFKVENLNTTSFPIIQKENKKISYILQIDGNDQIMLSKNYASKLNELSENEEKTNREPISLFGSEQSIFFKNQQGDVDNLIGKDIKPSELHQTPSVRSKDIVNLTNVLEESTAKKQASAASDSYDHVLLPWKTYELQTTAPWCFWHTLSAVINNFANRQVLTAGQLGKAVFPKATDEQLMDKDYISSLKLTDTLNYLKNKYSISLIYQQGKPSFETVKNEIKNRKSPLVLNLEPPVTTRSSNPIDGKSYSHSIVQVGYTASSNSSNAPYYHYWNPWWEDTFVVSSLAPYMQLSTYQYCIYQTIINFSPPKL